MDRSVNLPGSWNGKSREASKMAKKIHHPRAHTTKQQAPAAMSRFWAIDTLPLARFQYAPVRQPKAGIKKKKMPTKTRLVRSAQIM